MEKTSTAAMASSAPKRQQHALAIPMPGQGHVNPLMRLCNKLVSQEGFIITFVTIDFLHHSQTENQQQQAKHDDADDLGAPLPDIRRARIPLSPLQPFDTVESFFLTVQKVEPQIEQLLLRLQQQEPPVTCIISDLYITGATQGVADKFRLPRVALNCSSHSVLLIFHHVLDGALPLEEVAKAIAQRELLKEDIFREGLEGLPTLRVGDLMNYLGENSFCYKFIADALQETRRKARAMVVHSFQEIEGDALKVDMGLPVYAIGPLAEPIDTATRTSLWKEDDACISWLDKQPPSSVLYISFGSIASLSNPQFEELVAGLISSQRRFLWVFRRGLVKDAPYTTFPEDILSKTNGRGYATAWAPQVKVLEHPSTHGFLTHCGWNSTLEALNKGIPMICFPFFSDQFMDTKLIVEQWKVGLCFEENKASGLIEREEVERVVRALMEGEEGKLLHKNANFFKEACRQACSQEGQLFKNIKSLVRALE